MLEKVMANLSIGSSTWRSGDSLQTERSLCWLLRSGRMYQGEDHTKIVLFLFLFFCSASAVASVRSRIWNIKSYDLIQYSSFYHFTFLLTGTLNNEPTWGVCPTWYQAWGSNTGILALFCTLDWEYLSGCNSQQTKQEFCNWELTWNESHELGSRFMPVFFTFFPGLTIWNLNCYMCTK